MTSSRSIGPQALMTVLIWLLLTAAAGFELTPAVADDHAVVGSMATSGIGGWRPVLAPGCFRPASQPSWSRSWTRHRARVGAEADSTPVSTRCSGRPHLPATGRGPRASL